MSDEIYVIQAISSGPYGYPYDEIVDIAVCCVDPNAHEFSTVYHNLIHFDPKVLGKKKLDYLAGAGGIFAEEIYSGEDEKKVAEEVLDIIKGKNITSFDVKQEFGRYMTCRPWDITLQSSVMPSISAKMPISLKCKDPSDEAVTIRKAYRRLCKDDPACVGRGRRAIHLAQMSSQLLLYMRDKGKY